MDRRVLAASVVILLVALSGTAYFVAFSPNGSYSTNSSSSTGKTTSSASSSSSSSTTTTTGSDSVASSATSGSPTDWTTYHRDNGRSGYDPRPAFASASFGWRSRSLDGLVYAEPLVFGNSVLVATENDSVYALDAQSGNITWRSNLGNPVSGSSLPCGNINPSGITGTPVVDPATKTIYATVFVRPASHFLVALNTDTGKEKFRIPADPVGADPMVEQQRSALTLANGMVYVPYGGLAGDCGSYHGWVFGARADGTGNPMSYQVPTSREGGIWAPGGMAVDSAGNLYATTGNGASNTNFDYGNSVIKLSPSLQQESYFAPTNWLALNQGDTDLGSTGPVLVAATTLFQIGKDGIGYLLDTGSLNGIGSEVYSSPVCSGVFGSNAFDGSTLYVPCGDGIHALSISANSFSKKWTGQSISAAPPIIAGGAVWAIDNGRGKLYAFSISSGTSVFSYQLGQVNRFTTPSSGDGRIFTATGAQIVSILLT
jgi:outer membrane protein assembly factor BamB